MSVRPIQRHPDCPRAYGGCTCDCHRIPNVFHCRPCCTPLDALKDECVQDILEASDDEILADYLASGGTLEELRALKQKMLDAATPNKD
jgi:hypothetical protein